MTTYNIDPYFDDFEASKNFVKVLFKPGVAVQARELTQLQTAIQQQIKTIGGFLFDNESLVLGGRTRFSRSFWIDVASSDVSGYLGKNIVGADSGAKAQVVFTKNNVSSGVSRLYFSYKNGSKFQQQEVISEDDFSPDVPAVTSINTITFSGVASAFNIDESVFYVKDYFVVCQPQTIILADSLTPSVKVGLAVKEEIVTYQDDETLLDPATGSYNYAAPGADRLAISLDLIVYPYIASIDEDADNMVESTEDNFIEIARYKEGALVKSLLSPTLGGIEDVLARRTFDESGDYTVRSFKARAIDNVKLNSDSLTLSIDAGKAYVKGYEFETTGTVFLDLPKARSTRSVENYSGEASFGDYFIVNNPTGGLLTYTANQTISLRNAATTVIGSARVRYVQTYSSTKLKVFVYEVKLTTGALADVTTLFNSPWVATVDATNPKKLYRGKKQDFFVKFPNSPVKEVTDVSYQSQIQVNGTATSTTLSPTVSLSSGKTYPSSVADDYVVVDTVANTIVTGFTVTTSGGSSFTLTGTFTNGRTYNVYAKIAVSNATFKTKTKTQATVYVANSTSSRISLGVSDVYRVVSVTAKNSTTSAEVDVTGKYTLDRNQKDAYYDYGHLVLKSGQIPAPSASYNNLVVVIEYFQSNQTAGYYTVNSYNTLTTDENLLVPYESIPVYYNAAGEGIALRDVMDFRGSRATISGFPGSLGSPIGTGAETSINGDEFVEPLSLVTADFDYYLGRVDKLIVTKEKRFDLIEGISSETPQVPSDIPDAMTLYTINIPAYTFNASDVTLNYIENKRYTMRDIGKIDKRVDRLEYYTAMSLLEKQAADEMVFDSTGTTEKFKNGILVDPFAGHGVGDVGSAEYSCSIDTLNRELRPRFSSQSFLFDVNRQETASSEFAKKDDLITLPYTTEVAVSNTQATRTINLNPYLVFAWNGTMKLSPASDNWTDKETRPEVIVNVNGNNDAFTILADDVQNPASVGVKWADWQLVDKGVVITNISNASDAFTYALQSGRAIESKLTTTNTLTTTVTTDKYLASGIEIEKSNVSTITRDLGAKVVDASIVPFIRSRVVDYSASNLKPNTQLYATFDGIDVSRHCTQAPVIFTTTVANATEVRKIGTSKKASVVLLRADRAYVKMDADQALFTTGDIVEWLVNGVWVSGKTISDVSAPINETIFTDERGDVAGFFLIPNNSGTRFRSGERVFRLADQLSTQATTAAETKYVAMGLAMSVQNDIISTRVQTVSLTPLSKTDTRVTTAQKTTVTTNTTTKDVTVVCGETQSGVGSAGRYVYTLDFGTDIGACGINYDATGIPDRYTIIWNGNTYTTGFRGTSAYNSELSARGYPGVTTTIDANNTAEGKLRFQKTSIFPNKATLIVDAPLAGTRWAYKAICPGKTDNLLPETSPRLSVVVDTPSVVSVTHTTTQVSAPFATSPSYSFTVRIDGNQNVPVGTPVRINSITRSETTNGVWAAFSSGSRITLNGAIATFPITTAVGRTLTFGISYDATASTNTFGTNMFNSWRNPSCTLTASVSLVTAIDGYDGSTSGTDTVIHPTSFVVQAIQSQDTWGGGGQGGGSSPDPVSQTFVISSATNPDGIFVDSIDLFFRNKDSRDVPMTIQIRPTVNGYPSSSEVLPFATAELMSSQVVTSTPETANKLATKFSFQAPVYLTPDVEYAIVILVNSDQFDIYTSRLGEFLLSNPSVRCTKQPLMGSMFISQNGTTWTAEQYDDVLFRLRKCVFQSGVEKNVILDTVIPPLMKTSQYVDYDTIFVDGEILDFANTNVNYSYKASKASGSSFAKDAAWSNYQLGSNIALSERKRLFLTDGSTLRLRCAMTTQNPDVSPVIDVNRLSSVLVMNHINNSSNGEETAVTLEITNVTATTGVTTITTSASHNLSIGDMVFVNADLSNEISGNYAVLATPTATTFTYNRTDSGAAITSTAQGGSVIRKGQAYSRYVTRKVTLNSEFYSTDLSATYLAKIPTECAVKPYYRVTTLNDPVLEDNAWIPMVLASSGTPNPNGYVEYKYKVPYVVGGESAAVSTGEKFGTFAVKLVMLSSNPVKVPMIKDLRVLALDE